MTSSIQASKKRKSSAETNLLKAKKRHVELPPSTGTCISSFATDDALYVCWDGRSSTEMGEEILNGSYRKVFKLSKHVLLAGAGNGEVYSIIRRKIKIAIRKASCKIGFRFVRKLLKAEIRKWKMGVYMKELAAKGKFPSLLQTKILMMNAEVEYPCNLLVFGYKKGKAYVYDDYVDLSTRVCPDNMVGCGNGNAYSRFFVSKVIDHGAEITKDIAAEWLLASTAYATTKDYGSGGTVSVCALYKDKKLMREFQGKTFRKEHVLRILSRNINNMKIWRERILIAYTQELVYNEFAKGTMEAALIGEDKRGFKCSRVLGIGNPKSASPTIVLMLVFDDRAARDAYNLDEPKVFGNGKHIQVFDPTVQNIETVLGQYFTSTEDF